MEPEFFKKFVDLVKQFPIGSTVYNRASGERAIVVAYNILDQNIAIGVDSGKNGVDYYFPFILYKDKVAFDCPEKDGEDW
jgi:hypothetical protein